MRSAPCSTLLALGLLTLPALAQRPSVAPPVGPPSIDRALLPGARVELVYTPDGVSNGAQELVLWLPSSPTPANGYPVVVQFPGGGWKDPGPLPAEPTGLLAPLRDAGFAVARARYTYVDPQFPGGGVYPSAEEDTLAVVQHLRFKAAEYRLDGERLFLSGRSAGGHGVQAAALWPDRADPEATDQRRESSKPDGVLLASVAATHVPSMLQTFASGLAPYLGGPNPLLQSVPQAAQLAASPTQWVGLDPAGSAQVPFFVIGSPREIVPPLGQPYVLNAVDHKHDPWNAATLWAELQTLGGVHSSLSIYLDTFLTPYTSAQLNRLQQAWLEQLVALMDRGWI